MFQQSKNHRSKKQVEAELHFDTGETLLGKLSISPDQRVSDLLNDDRDFIPVETSDGLTVIFRKTTITKILPLQLKPDTVDQSDPYVVLGVKRDISDEELASVFRKICAQNHPDKIHASGMAAPFLKLAHSRMIKINSAYQRILELRRAANNRRDE